MDGEKKKLVIGGATVIVCLTAAAIAYSSLSSAPAADNSKSAAAEAHSAEIRKSIEADPASQAPPPEIERPKTKGVQRVGG